MTHQHFSALSKLSQQEVVLKEGIFIADRLCGSFLVVLYQVDTFYVEIFYLRSNYTIFLLKSFTSTDLLEPYLQHIDVVELVNNC